MIEYIRQAYGVDRVAIVDTDCHHGDGTQDIYWHDPDTLFISIHQDGRTLYPGSGFPHELGGINAVGKTLNIPLPPYTSEEGFLYTVKNIVMPILAEFKPDLIVNSAGQDNHYTDPITNMNFSAQGYARLTEILNPDIAVLEGGYSIEGALPYVNVGIVLAMAGVDFSKVTEPNYDPDTIRQTREVTDAIENIGENILTIWQQRENIRDQLMQKTNPRQRTRSIYYDTDGIRESQNEQIRICRDCGGALRIESSSDRGFHILAVHIPSHACDKCRDAGYEWYQKANSNEYDIIFLQDRPADGFHVKARGNTG
jgi:hypothetical protein